MSCQIGIYERPHDDLDHWTTLIHIQDAWTPRDLLRNLTPFLKQFHSLYDMGDAAALGAWLTWHLIQSGLVAPMDFPRIGLSREIRTDIDFFCRISPGWVEMYRVDEILEWRLIAAMEIPQQSVQWTTEAETR